MVQWKYKYTWVQDIGIKNNENFIPKKFLYTTCVLGIELKSEYFCEQFCVLFSFLLDFSSSFPIRRISYGKCATYDKIKKKSVDTFWRKLAAAIVAEPV